MSGRDMSLREALARIAAALEVLARVAAGYEVRRPHTTREADWMNGRPMDEPPERLQGPSSREMAEARAQAEARRAAPGGRW